MKKQDLYHHVLAYLEEVHRSDTETELHYGNPFELIVAVVLSAQCTDKRINLVTPALFAAYPTPAEMAKAEPEDIFEYIKTVSYPNNKARHLAGLARRLMEAYGGRVPDKLEDLVTLPGVGRKTANVIRAVAFGLPALAVDTHVFRVSHRLGLVPARCTTPYSVEMELKRHIPEGRVAASHYWLLLHGRYVCTARSPKCDQCGLRNICRSAGKCKAPSKAKAKGTAKA